MLNLYDENYYERGVETGKSGYQNYRWLPELTIPMAMTIIDYLRISRKHEVLDYGAAKGFLVKALRLLHRQAWGVDISEYAINCADNDTRRYLELSTPDYPMPFDKYFDFIIAKDVLEHIDEGEVDSILDILYQAGKVLFAIIPLGKDNKYVIPAYEMDVTHKLAKEPDWWTKKFESKGWNLKEFSFYIPGIKESWSNFKGGNGFFLLVK